MVGGGPFDLRAGQWTDLKAVETGAPPDSPFFYFYYARITDAALSGDESESVGAIPAENFCESHITGI